MAPSAPDFNKLIQEGRERKKNEALANRIFSSNRRQSAPSKLKASTGPSLASRVGVKKAPAKQTPQQRVLNSTTRRSSMPASGNVNGEWTHDLHDSVNGSGSLMSRTTTAPSLRAAKRKQKLAAGLDKMDLDSDAVKRQANVIKPPAMGLTIRGLAGPFPVMAQNFAPGTTAADIESAMTPIGGEMSSCKIIKTSPFIIVEMVFVSREGGERVIETFNDKTADGRLIKVYAKPGGYSAAPSNAPSGPRGSRPAKGNTTKDQVVDGSMGFPDLMAKGGAAAGGSNNASGNNRPLYSDKIVAGNKRGRGGFGSQRGRGGR